MSIVKTHKPINNLGNFAHPPKAQTKPSTPKLIGPSGDKKRK